MAQRKSGADDSSLAKRKLARDYAEAILRTSRDPMVVLRTDLRVNNASEAFYKTFKITAGQIEGRLFFEILGGVWETARLRTSLEGVLLRNGSFNDFELTPSFPQIGSRTMLLNARRLDMDDGSPDMILLAIEDVTERLETQNALRVSEMRYRRLFEAARDGVLLIDPQTRRILDANPFMTELLGYRRDELLGQELFEIGLLKDERASRTAFRELQKQGFIRYENLPLETKTGARREVEFVSNLYQENGYKIVQCNIRDITERKRSEDEFAREPGATPIYFGRGASWRLGLGSS